MDKEQIRKAVQQLNTQPKRKFVQSYDFIINLKNLVVSQNPIDLFLNIPHPSGRKVKIAAFADQQLLAEAEKNCDLVIRETDFSKYSDKKKLKKLAEEYDYFIAQSTLMTKVASAFGKVLGTKGKMPNPKLGCVVPPNAGLAPLAERLVSTVRLTSKKANNLQCMVGKESQPENEIVDNIFSVYQAVIKHVPDEAQNIKNASVKLTMGKPVRI